MTVEIEISTLLKGANRTTIPSNLAGLIDQNQWKHIIDSIQVASTEASTGACFLACGLCFICSPLSKP